MHCVIVVWRSQVNHLEALVNRVTQCEAHLLIQRVIVCNSCCRVDAKLEVLLVTKSVVLLFFY